MITDHAAVGVVTFPLSGSLTTLAAASLADVYAGVVVESVNYLTLCVEEE